MDQDCKYLKKYINSIFSVKKLILSFILIILIYGLLNFFYDIKQGISLYKIIYFFIVAIWFQTRSYKFKEILQNHFQNEWYYYINSDSLYSEMRGPFASNIFWQRSKIVLNDVDINDENENLLIYLYNKANGAVGIMIIFGFLGTFALEKILLYLSSVL